MQIDDYIAAVRREGELIAVTSETLSLDDPIPTCPGWQVRDLLRHLSSVHRWATEAITRPAHASFGAIEDRGGPWPADDELIAWFREGHAALVRALETAPPDLDCWYFLPAPSPLAFWARRQAHETAIHRADIESVRGAISPYDPEFALDGVDELLFGFVARPQGKLRSPVPQRLLLYSVDPPARRLISIGESGATIQRASGTADCTVAGRAPELYPFLWNR